MKRTAGVRILASVLCCAGMTWVPDGRAQGTGSVPTRHGREFWRQIAKNHYAVPEGQEAWPLVRELSGYLSLPDPELRDDLAYSILTMWIGRQKKLSTDQLVTLVEEWQGNLSRGVGEVGTDSVFKRSFSALCLEILASRDLKEPFLGEVRYRKLLEEAVSYLRDERDLRGFDGTKGWIHATAHTADLLASLAENPLFTKQDQGRVLEAISRRLATANEIFAYGEQDRLANVAAAIIARKDFDRENWNSWVTRMNEEDSAVWRESPPKLPALARFENDSYFLRAVIGQISLRGNTPETGEAQKTVLSVLRRR